MKQPCTKSIPLGDNTFTISCGSIAKQADGAMRVQYGDSVVLVTACAERKMRGDGGFLPLTVDYREYTYAAGKIPGGFFKREGRPTEKETLTSRLIDRPLRPLFPDGYGLETQIIAMVLSADRENNTDVHALTGASAALYLSPIPFMTPIAAVRVGLIDGEYKINPTFAQMEESRLDLIIAGSEDSIVMVESGSQEVSESEMVEAFAKGHEAIKKLVDLQKEMYAELNVKKFEYEGIPSIPEDIKSDVEGKYRAKLKELLGIADKIERGHAGSALKDEMIEAIPEDERDDKAPFYKRAFGDMEESLVRECIIKDRKRTDGRAFDKIRDVTCDLDVLPRTHGSAIFTRGETQALVTITLGSASDQQRMETLEGEFKKRFMLHYNFPPFSVGECRFLRGPKRREIGHGALAERAIRGMLPDEKDFGYTLRIVSDILESNGSSSMATVCGATLALMAGGVNIKSPVAGIAMGLVSEDGAEPAILTDIAGYEDHYGDMDFKVTGTREGITALQMDIKISGLSMELMSKALEQAKTARFELLDTMQKAIEKPRDNYSPHAPRLIVIMIDKEDIGTIIGPGGKMIRSIQDATNSELSIEDDGSIQISALKEEDANKAIAMVKALVEKPEIGKVYTGKVKTLKDFGAFIEIIPGKDGLLHISDVSLERVGDINDVFKEGDEVTVKLVSVDDRGKLRLSKKVLDPDYDEAKHGQSDRPRGGGGGRGGFRGGDRGGRGGGGGYRGGGGDRGGDRGRGGPPPRYRD